jgi:peptidoglycan/LPS O-acetylase OafA/YrhL
MGKSNRLVELDVLRGIAALGVVLYHYTTNYNHLYGHSKEVLVDFPHGPYGVSLFFMISGFVILMSLEKTKSSLDFVVGRLSRLYPAYWIAVILTFSIVSIAGLPGKQVSWQIALVNLTMFQSFLKFPPHVEFNVDGGYWTLGVELSFYLIMFALYKSKLLKHIEIITIVWLFFMILNIVFDNQIDLLIDTRIRNFFLLGFANAYYANLFIAGMMFYKIKTDGLYLKRYAIIAACFLVYELANNWNWKTAFVFILFVIVFDFMLKGKLAFMKQKPLIFFGTISYTLYLVHQNIGYVIIRTLYQLKINPNTSIFVAIVLSIVLASTITFLIEQPMIRLIREQYKTRILRADL